MKPILCYICAADAATGQTPRSDLPICEGCKAFYIDEEVTEPYKDIPEPKEDKAAAEEPTGMTR